MFAVKRSAVALDVNLLADVTCRCEQSIILIDPPHLLFGIPNDSNSQFSFNDSNDTFSVSYFLGNSGTLKVTGTLKRRTLEILFSPATR